MEARMQNMKFNLFYWRIVNLVYACTKFIIRVYKIYTVKNVSEIFPKIVGQLKIQMERKFFQRYIGNISDIELEIVPTVWSEKYSVY